MEATLFDREPKLTTTALAPWFGSNRMLAPLVAAELKGCKWVGVPFAGGMSELAHIKASTIVVSDLHRHVINLARIVKCDATRKSFVQALDTMPFHPEVLSEAQEHCRQGPDDSLPVDFAAARDYFVSCWMGRSHKAGIDDEFNGGLSIRWNANGGDSNTRYRSAVASLEAWGEIMRRCNFSVLDCFEFLERCEDSAGHGIYCDAPWPEEGDRYKHRFTESQQRKLAASLIGFENTRIVVRYGDHPLIRELYPKDKWRWNLLDGRSQANKKQREVLLVRN